MTNCSQTETDLKVLEDVLKSAVRAYNTVRFLEIGVFGGETARWIKRLADSHGVRLEYWGIDNGSHPNFVRAGTPPQPPFAGANLVIGDSAEVFMHVPDELDIVLVDGDHGGNAVILDTILYGAKVRRFGFMLFHDTAPHVQQTMREQHGPDHPWFYNSVVAAHRLMGFPTDEWVVFEESCDPNAAIGGMTAYRKLCGKGNNDSNE